MIKGPIEIDLSEVERQLDQLDRRVLETLLELVQTGAINLSRDIFVRKSVPATCAGSAGIIAVSFCAGFEEKILTAAKRANHSDVEAHSQISFGRG
jgi:hypothetical protein